MYSKIKNILCLCGWFPSRVDFLEGDFVERHLKSASLYSKITVIYVVKDINLNKQFEIVQTKISDNLEYHIGYYKGKSSTLLLNRIISYFKYLILYFKLITKNVSKIDFDIFHFIVPNKQSIFVYYLKMFFNKPIVVTEHNTKWLFTIKKVNWFSVKINPVHFLFRNANAVHVPSKYLGNKLINLGLIKNYSVIANVVDTSIFNFSLKKIEKDNRVKYVTINGNNWQKNVDGVLRAFKILLNKGFANTLTVIGPNNESLQILANELNISNNIFFTGSISNSEVAKFMKESDALILFSRFETFGCVMIEANCCGLPVIASRLEVIEENLQENFNVIFVQSENENELVNAMIYLQKNYNNFSKNDISQNAIANYNYNAIGKSFLQLYNSVL